MPSPATSAPDLCVDPPTFPASTPTTLPSHPIDWTPFSLDFNLIPILPRPYKKIALPPPIMSPPQANYRLIDIDALDADAQFPPELLNPPCPPVDISEIQGFASQCRQLLQRGDQEAALKVALENVPYGGDEAGKVYQLATQPNLLPYLPSEGAFPQNLSHKTNGSLRSCRTSTSKQS